MCLCCWGTLSTSPSSSKSPECVLSFTAIFRAIFVTYFIFYIFLRTSIYFANFVLSSQLSFKEINFNFFDSLVGGKELIIMLISIFFSDSLWSWASVCHVGHFYFHICRVTDFSHLQLIFLWGFSGFVYLFFLIRIDVWTSVFAKYKFFEAFQTSGSLTFLYEFS